MQYAVSSTTIGQRQRWELFCQTFSQWWRLDLLTLYVLQDFKGEQKIGSESHYSSIARDLSHLLRAEIKESFKEINGTLKV